MRQSNIALGFPCEKLIVPPGQNRLGRDLLTKNMKFQQFALAIFLCFCYHIQEFRMEVTNMFALWKLPFAMQGYLFHSSFI